VSEIELKPCPFCGGSVISIHDGTTFRWMVAECADCGAQCGEVRVQTMGSGTPEEWEEKAHKTVMEEWNRRVTLTDFGGANAR
jgi:Lar family restriction alleviation protein